MVARDRWETAEDGTVWQYDAADPTVGIMAAGIYHDVSPREAPDPSGKGHETVWSEDGGPYGFAGRCSCGSQIDTRVSV
jgi:hypothetical protein